MKKTIAVITVSIAGLWIASCAEPATAEEIDEMCQHLGGIGGDSASPDAARAKIAQVNEEYDARLRKLEAEKADAIARIDADEDLALAEVKPQDAAKRTAIVNEFAKKTSDKSIELDGKIKQQTEERDAAVKTAQETADAAEASWNEVVYKCTTDGAGVSKPVAQCRIAAATKDAWDKCE
jgi:hypothetical protein